MSVTNDDNTNRSTQLASHLFGELLDSLIIDVASECHRAARLGLDRKWDEEEEELRLSAQARAMVADPNNSGEANGKYSVDIFGQTHPAIASEIFECMNCGHSIMAGRFAPHLEKCMGKGRKARMKATRSSTATPTRQTRAAPISVHSPYTNPHSGSPGASATKSNGTSHAKSNGTSHPTENYYSQADSSWKEQ